MNALYEPTAAMAPATTEATPAIEYSEPAEECDEETAEPFEEPQTAEAFPMATEEGENCEGDNEGAEMAPVLNNILIEAGNIEEADYMMTGNFAEEHEALEIEECEE